MTWLTVLVAVMTLTVESKNAVIATGDMPPSVEAYYACNYQKGTVREGDEAVLELSGLCGVTINKVEVYIRSNKNSGAGTWFVSVNNQTVMTKSGSFDQWFSAFDNVDYHSLSLLPKAYSSVQEMAIRLQGTTNSLYIEKYVITYTPAPVHTVTLMRGNEVYQTLTEYIGGAGVFLPSMDDYNGWRFIGWSETEWDRTTERPQLIAANRQCYPLSDVTLWAAYEWIVPDDSVYISDLTDGEYLYLNTQSRMALAGVPDKGKMQPEPIDRAGLNQLYTVTFNAAKDTAYVVHTVTGIPIGYNSQRQMVADASPWRVYHRGVETILYTTIADKNYVLWLDIEDLQTGEYYAALTAANPQNSPLRLANPASENEQVYTCHPEFGMGFEQSLETIKNEYILPFGCYEMIIRNGEKELRLR